MRLPLKLGVAGFLLILLSVIVGFIALNPIVRFGIRQQTALKRKSEIRNIYLKLPFPLDFRVYFFNISNPMEVQKGATPILTEIGPYCYDEFKEKIDVLDNDAEDSLTYYPYDIYKFNAEKSGKLSDTDYVTILHPALVGMVNQATRDSPALLSIVNKAIGPIFRDPESIYLTAKVKDILFDGVELNCKVTEFAAKAVCTQIKSQIPGIKSDPEKSIFLFSLLGVKNATVGKSIKVSRGISNSRDLGKVLEFDGKKVLKLWYEEQCNHFKGTDGWIIPPLLKPEEGLWSFSADLCRNVVAEYVEDSVTKGVKTRRYEATLADMQNNEEDKCYCPTPKTCLRKGVFDLSKCMGVPILATLPHFLEADEIYLQQVKGLNPILDKHIIRIQLEPMTGTPIEARKRLQFNLPVSASEKITLMRNVSTSLHPIFWIEEGVELDGALLEKVTEVFTFLGVFQVFRWLGLLIGFVSIAYAVYHHMKHSRSVHITPISGSSSSDHVDINRSTNELVGKMKEVFQSDKGHTNPVMTGHEFDRYS
uniref:Sensory neuron membrane protein SNMP1b n=1 Tax=Colaphellus bowringi TaxID=561076 RepID=A0A0S3J2R4_9CUCU|nr:sensory neuron membrane protein SNMP1b [Colaphellus bowringi]